MHKRTTPKIVVRAKELRCNMTPAEEKLWSHLRAHHMGDVHFRTQHAIGNYVVDFCAPRKKLIIELVEANTWSRRNTMQREPRSWNPKDTKYCASGTMTCGSH